MDYRFEHYRSIEDVYTKKTKLEIDKARILDTGPSSAGKPYFIGGSRREFEENATHISHLQIATNAINTSWPREKKLPARSIQENGYSHLKKTTKSEKNKIHTKHQRGHVKRAVIHLCKEDQDLALVHSMDDKAYLKPEAYDWLDKCFKLQAKLNITPSVAIGLL
ncbi:unnamed protein product [Mytilus coruscus]|uniref:Uncharacterized protein n=1 Tax=Mytilus coruscus TaxID=42192 RepID=A0A6J8DTU1_MYTCO|nr:unnamed protein product [Mytilus coruscus]